MTEQKRSNFVDWPSMGVCKFWMLRRCYSGAACQFEHPVEWKKLWDDELEKQRIDELNGIPRPQPRHPRSHSKNESDTRHGRSSPSYGEYRGTKRLQIDLVRPPRRTDDDVYTAYDRPGDRSRNLPQSSSPQVSEPPKGSQSRNNPVGARGPTWNGLTEDKRIFNESPVIAVTQTSDGERLRTRSMSICPEFTDAQKYRQLGRDKLASQGIHNMELLDNAPEVIPTMRNIQSVQIQPATDAQRVQLGTEQEESVKIEPSIRPAYTVPAKDFTPDITRSPPMLHESRKMTEKRFDLESPAAGKQDLRSSHGAAGLDLRNAGQISRPFEPAKSIPEGTGATSKSQCPVGGSTVERSLPSRDAMSLDEGTEHLPETSKQHNSETSAGDKSAGKMSYWERHRAKKAARAGKTESEVEEERKAGRDQPHHQHASLPANQHQRPTPAKKHESKATNMGTNKRSADGETKHPPPSVIRVSAPYSSQARIDKRLQSTPADGAASTQERSFLEAREINVRLQGVTWIDNVRRALELPIRTYTTACVYFHKLRLAHPNLLNGVENGVPVPDACAASLLTACKVEDTLKKSRDVLAAAYNIKAAPLEQLGSDDPLFETQSKNVIGLERMVLEAGGFDFRSKHPHVLLVKIAKSLPGPTDEKKQVGKIAFTVLTDLHRTFAPLKQVSAALCLASIELAAHLVATASPGGSCFIRDELKAYDIKIWSLTREEIMETLLDALDLYTHHTSSTALGPMYSLEDFLRIRLVMNKECTESNLPRYTTAPEPTEDRAGNGSTSRLSNGHPTPVSPPQLAPPAQTQQQQHANTSSGTNNGEVSTFRFMLNPQRAADEKTEVKKYFSEEWEEYEEEIEVPIPRPSSRDRARGEQRNDVRERLREAPTSADGRRERGDIDSLRARSDREHERERERDRERLWDRDREVERDRDRARLKDRDYDRDRRRYDEREYRRYDDRRMDEKRDRRYDEDRRRRDDRR